MELMLRDPGAKLIPFRKLESSIPSCCRLRTPVPDLNADAYLDDLPGEFMNQAKKRKLRKKWSLTDYKEGDADLLNRWTEVAAFLREFPGEIDKAHISVLPPGNVLRVHQDGLGTDGGKRSLHDMFNRTLRFHVALRTTPESYLYADGELVQMKPGECWMINNMKYHSAANGSTSHPRVHLIFDVRPTQETMDLVANAQQDLGVRDENLFRRYWPDAQML